MDPNKLKPEAREENLSRRHGIRNYVGSEKSPFINEGKGVT